MPAGQSQQKYICDFETTQTAITNDNNNLYFCKGVFCQRGLTAQKNIECTQNVF